MMPYFINVGLIVTGCLAFYKIFLQKETFYRLNRSVLLVCLIASFALPLLPIPQEWSFRKAKEHTIGKTVSPPVREIVQKALARQKSAERLTIQPEATSPLSHQAAISSSESTISLSQILKALVWLYWFGVIVFILNFLLQIAILFLRVYSNPAIQDGKYRIVQLTAERSSPCSFLNYIFINPDRYDWSTYNQILLHEKVHVSEGHSIDILFAEIMVIFQWFNPFAWIYRKEVENNLEFLTDQAVLQNGEMEMSTYQMSLLKVSAAHLPLSLTTNYNQSLLKKRIAMMNARKSNLNSGWKYFFILPLFIFFACLLNEPVVNAQTKNTKSSTATNKNTTSNSNKNVDIDLNGTVTTKQNPKTGKTDRILSGTVNVNTNTNANVNTNTNVGANTDVNTNTHVGYDHDGMATQGYWFATIEGDRIQIDFTETEKRDSHSHNGSDFKLSDFPNLPRGANGDFSLTREAGTLNFNGKFDGNKGSGKYKFVADKSYADFMNQRISNKIDEGEQLVFFMLDVKKSYVQMLNDEGYTKLDNDNVIAMTALKVDKDHIDALKQNGYTNVDVEDLISTRALNIDGNYIKQIHDAGYKDISLEQLVSFKAQGIDKEYLSKVSKMKDGNEKMDAEDVISLKAMGIDDTYADQFKQLGYNNIKHEELISMKAVGVTPEYIKNIQQAGYTDATVDNLIAMKSLNVTPDFVKGFRAIGYKDIDADNLVALKSLGVTPDFIKGFQQIGYKNIPIDQVISVKAVGITPAYVKSMKQKGFNYNSLEKYVTLKSIGSSD
jgi:beta-lactamase regulating signal transducer with metallopeptidase domain